MAKGQYTGTFIDVINIYQIHVSSPDCSGTLVTPWDVYTNTPMTFNDWVSYHADFLTAIKNKLPGEKVGNVYWAAYKSKTKDTEQALQQLDYVLLERGFNDAGLTGGTRKFSMYLYVKWIDYLHGIGVHFVTLEREKVNNHRRNVALAYYLLTTNGNDILGSNYHQWATRQNWWAGWVIDLGRAKSKRFQHPDGIWERKFQKGIVLTAEPGQKPTNVKLSKNMKLWQKPVQSAT